ncbi:MAG TPA: hypothetical protein VI387_10770 [Candidatus Brocadiales bacterium]|nr:hypothetical protein [Candidatus Brocadiales bacterium]
MSQIPNSASRQGGMDKQGLSVSGHGQTLLRRAGMFVHATLSLRRIWNLENWDFDIV